jgi:predicted permease
MGRIRFELWNACRSLWRHRSFSAVALATIALGLGCATFLIALYAQIVLRELPVERPAELVLAPLTTVSASGEERSFGRYSAREVEEFGRAASGAAELAAYADGEALVGHDGVVEKLPVMWVTASYFDVLGLRPASGRLFTERLDGSGDAAPAAVLSHAAWLRRFGGEPASVGHALGVGEQATTIVGVAPASFRGIDVGAAPELYLLARQVPADQAAFRLFGRLAPTSSAASLEQRLRSALAAFRATQPSQQRFMVVDGKSSRAEDRIDVVPGARGESSLRGTFSRTLLLVGGMLAVVLLVLVANLATLLAARSLDESRQAGVRLALGASPRRLAASWLAECALLTLAGAALGIGMVALWGRALLAALPVPDLDRAIDLTLDFRAVAATFALAFGCGLAIGALGAWQQGRTSPLVALRAESSTATGGVSRGRWRWALVAIQVALSVVLLVGMGLLVRSLGKLLAIDTGLQLDSLLTFRVDLPQSEAQPRAALERLRSELAALPGVISASYASTPVLEAWSSFAMLSVEGYRPAPDESVMVNVEPAGPALFGTLGLPILSGRAPGADDLFAEPKPVVVNQRFVERYFPGESPLGRRLSFDFRRGSFAEPRADDLEIVGVVADGPLAHLREKPMPRFYPPLDVDARSVSFLARTRLAPSALVATIPQLVRGVIPQAALSPVRTMVEQRDRLLARERFLSGLSLAFGALALTLVALGLFGVVSFATGRRAKEIALRMVLGANGADVARAVLVDAAIAVAAGAAAGLALAVPGARLLRGFLAGVEPIDPLSFGGALLILAVAAVAACWLPARRSTLLDPAPLLRAE